MIEFFSRTDVGMVRPNNEDYHLIDSDNGLTILADGVGGHDYGEIASRMSVESSHQYLTRESYLEDTGNIRVTLAESILFANQQVMSHKKAHPEQKNMGTTLSLVHALEDEINFAWIGDSRIYLIDEAKALITQLNTDHTLYEEMMEQGKIAEKYQKSILTRMIGNNPYIKPEAGKESIESGQCILVCSDGLTDLVPDERILETFSKYNSSMELTMERLIELANGQGGRDNITVAIIKRT